MEGCLLPTERVYTFQDVRVNFPGVAYSSQVALMKTIIASLNKRENCLLESPTGTGKSLAILCSTLAWQERRTGVKIFYATRTHAQIDQIIGELRKTSYHHQVKMCILSSRDRACIHGEISRVKNKDEECSKILREPARCQFYASSSQLNHSALKSSTWDLEDIVQLGRLSCFCPYFGLQKLMQSSDIIFCPYNYLLDPIIRSNMKISLDRLVIIFDEGHNIEDLAREVASFSTHREVLCRALSDVESINGFFGNCLSRLASWTGGGGTDKNKVFKGRELLDLMTAEFGLGPSDLPRFAQALENLAAASSETISLLKKLYTTLKFLYRSDSKFIVDYRCVIAPDYTFNLWCMNPGACFSEFSQVHSLIITSGTLSPLSSFQSELSLSFPNTCRAVRDSSRAWVGTISRGPENGIRAVYPNYESPPFQDEIGRVVLSVCRTVPDGVLCFFSSYHNLDRVKNRWEATGLLKKIKKLVVTETRGREGFETILEAYYSAIRKGGGALFLAVHRGKVSEGINFSDNNARAVVSIGIPYPNAKDIKVNLKRKYNDLHGEKRSLMNGYKWYQAQAYRSLNQALGRCIRHERDWGALILVDERFGSDARFVQPLSDWIRKEIRHFVHFSDAMSSLKSFTQARESGDIF